MSEIKVTFHNGNRQFAQGTPVHWDHCTGHVSIRNGTSVAFLAPISAIQCITGTFTVVATEMSAK